MTFWGKIKAGLIRFMQGRNGPDQLSTHAVWAALAMYLIALLTGWQILSILGMALWVYSVFRMLSRNREKRFTENQRYVAFKGNIGANVRQAGARFKSRKQYRYFVCPQCKTRLRLPRGVGEVNVRCKQCGHTFSGKA